VCSGRSDPFLPFPFFFFFFPPAVELDLARDLARPLQGRRYRVGGPVQGRSVAVG
jgi:hypothetical protein